MNWHKVGSNLTAICHLLKVSKCLMLSFVLTRFLLSFFPCIRTIWHRNTYFLNFFCCSSSFLEKKSRYLWHLLRYLRNSYRFRIRFQNGSIWAPQNDRSLNISYPDIFTHSIFERNFWFCKIHLKKKPVTFPIINSIILIYLLTNMLALNQYKIKRHYTTKAISNAEKVVYLSQVTC